MYVQIFEAHNFRRFPFSNNSWKQFFADQGIQLDTPVFIFYFMSLIFVYLLAKTSKIICLENLDSYGIHVCVVLAVCGRY